MGNTLGYDPFDTTFGNVFPRIKVIGNGSIINHWEQICSCGGRLHPHMMRRGGPYSPYHNTYGGSQGDVKDDDALYYYCGNCFSSDEPYESCIYRVGDEIVKRSYRTTRETLTVQSLIYL